MRYLVDKSVLARVSQREVELALMPHLGQLVTCSIVRLELGWSATSSKHYSEIEEDIGWYELLEINQQILDGAEALQRRLVDHGHHRGPGLSDLIIAATALHHDTGVLHYDADYDTIRKVEPALHAVWIVPRGSVS